MGGKRGREGRGKEARLCRLAPCDPSLWQTAEPSGESHELREPRPTFFLLTIAKKEKAKPAYYYRQLLTMEPVWD